MHKPNILQFIQTITAALQACCQDKLCAEQEAWWLIEKATNSSKTDLLTKRDLFITQEQQAQLTDWVAQRVKDNKPLAYILGSVPFCDLEILVQPPILIPRPETEEWVSWLIDILRKEQVENITILDLCCGSGCIGLALAKAFPKCKVLGIDINPQAIKLSIENKKHNKIKNIDFIQSDLYQNLPHDFKCDLIVSNPPYLTNAELNALDPAVKNWEDHSALVAQNEGMYFYDKIFKESSKYINPIIDPISKQIKTTIPQIVVEIGPAQKDMPGSLKPYKFKKVTVYNDMQGKNRWVGCWI
jgi:release factor glutamine methyltransferase